MGKNYHELAAQVVELVGGKENISHALHCATRLRFNLADESVVKVEELKAVKGVLGVMKAGGQYQVVIGPDVDKVFDEVCLVIGQNATESDAAKETKIEEGAASSDGKTVTKAAAATGSGKAVTKKWTAKRVFAGILDALSGSLGPVIPVITACAFFKMLTSLLGPDMLGLLAAESDVYTLLTFVGDAGFYFFPVIIGYTAAKKFNVMPVLGILLGCIMMHPTFTGMAAEGTAFKVFGIPCMVQNYSSTILPIIISVWIMSYIEKFFNKILPTSIRAVFAPAFTILIMLPITLCIVGPAGAFLGNYVVGGLLGLQNVIGFFGMALIAALYPLLVMTGMHMVLIAALFQVFATQGFDGFAGPALTFASFSVMGVCVGAMLRLRDKEQKALAAEFAVTAIVAGTSEPCLYGICTRYKRPFIGLIAGGFAGGLYAGIMGVISANLVPSTNFLSALAFTGKSNANLINGLIGCAIALVVAAIVTYLFGFSKDEPAIQKNAE